jgi:hypothetical protein
MGKNVWHELAGDGSGLGGQRFSSFSLMVILFFFPFSLEPPVEEERQGKFAYQNSSGILGNQ